ncbi:hypothetical protein M758_1G120900 [Ceratodon purpureus]|nr:hypothetical protein M758_1G120900 [Ceratodon purpureus]
MGEVYKVDPEYHEERQRRKHAIKRMVMAAVLLLVILLIVLGLITFIVWLVLRPIHSPSWEVDDVKVLTINIQSSASRRRLADVESTKNWGITTYLLNADIVVALRACNRNKHMEVIYDRVDIKVAYATAVFGRVMVPGFTQAKSNVTHVGTEVKAMSVPVSFVLANALQSDIQSGNLNFEVYVDVRARVKIGGYKSFGFGRKTMCEVCTTTPTSGRPGQVVTKKCHSHRS